MLILVMGTVSVHTDVVLGLLVYVFLVQCDEIVDLIVRVGIVICL